MVHYPIRYKKGIAIDMRKRGFSYSEISDRLGVAKSTLNFWLKKVPLDESVVKKMSNRRLEALRKASRARTVKISQAIQTIKNSSTKDIGKVSPRELWLMGIMLYWKESLVNNVSDNIKDLKKSVSLSSSDPNAIKFFLKWLREVGRIEDDEILFDLFLRDPASSVSALEKQEIRNKSIEHWSRITGFSKELFSHIYFQKGTGRLTKGRRSKSNPQVRKREKSPFGFLRIRVKASSLLARQIAGWANAIQKILLLT